MGVFNMRSLPEPLVRLSDSDGHITEDILQ